MRRVYRERFWKKDQYEARKKFWCLKNLILNFKEMSASRTLSPFRSFRLRTVVDAHILANPARVKFGQTTEKRDTKLGKPLITYVPTGAFWAFPMGGYILGINQVFYTERLFRIRQTQALGGFGRSDSK